ncbi:hypothetical protein KsCSTR_34910 [Candidatus Kuenenia stuttgartiensis]|uniref:Uncharacterized protein n=1 Tax=Kuenenia stuttgartiensis TaxID=174633 RepID=Q1Q6W2_KUEST|nr:hypothetical protein KsCSTR_34910 [Candidatus Kuenenia stuttgartiensis]CAJ73321.1 unknown protein [Candidatus Kuenenia stuttgartiensis]
MPCPPPDRSKPKSQRLMRIIKYVHAWKRYSRQSCSVENRVSSSVWVTTIAPPMFANFSSF